MKADTKLFTTGGLTFARWVVGIITVVLIGNCAYTAYSNIQVEEAIANAEEAIANSPPIVETASSECEPPSPRPEAICALSWWYPIDGQNMYHPAGFAEAFEVLETAPEYVSFVPGGIAVPVALYYMAEDRRC